MRTLKRWLFGTRDEHPLRRRLRLLGFGVPLAPLLKWVLDGGPPPLALWLECIGCGLVLLLLVNYRPGRRRRTDAGHRVTIVEHHPPPDERWRPYSTAECSCGWTLDDHSPKVTEHMARRHCTTGTPTYLRQVG